MRLAVAVLEDGYLLWLERLAATMSAVVAVNSPEGHVVVRTGSLIDVSDYLTREWSGGTDDDRGRVIEVWRKERVAIIYLEGVSSSSVAGLVTRLRNIEGFVGIVDVTREPRGSYLLQSTLPFRYRLVGDTARVVYTFEDIEDMSEIENRREWLLDLGVFRAVSLEDVGVRDTIFDGSTNDGYRALRVNEIVALAPEPDHAETAVLWLDVIDFRLTDSLHAATSACALATYSEQAAQGALSCRRFLEQLADSLFNPQDTKRNGRWVREQDWRNRLWAAIDEALGPGANPNELLRLGNVVDEIKDAADTGVHRKPPISPDDAARLIAHLLAWLNELARIIPPSPESSMEPYEKEILRIMRKMFLKDDED